MRRLEKGDSIKLLSVPELMGVLQMRNFCTDDETRREVANLIGGKKGVVWSIEDKWAFDYFYFLPDGNEPHQRYSIPYESVDFNQS